MSCVLLVVGDSRSSRWRSWLPSTPCTRTLSSSESWRLAAFRMRFLALAASSSLTDGVHDGFDEVVEGAAVGAGAEALDGLGRPGGIDIGPAWRRSEKILASSSRVTPRQEVVLRADDDGQGVGADAELDRRAADGLAVFDFAVLDRAAGVGDVGLAGLAEALEAAPVPMLSMVMLPA